MPSDGFDGLARSTLKKSTKLISSCSSPGRVVVVHVAVGASATSLAAQGLGFAPPWTGTVWYGVVRGPFSSSNEGGKGHTAGLLDVVRDA